MHLQPHQANEGRNCKLLKSSWVAVDEIELLEGVGNHGLHFDVDEDAAEEFNYE